MIKYTIRRLLQAIPTIIGITIIAMGIMILAPGNPASQLAQANPDMSPQQRAAMIEAMGVNAPVHVQYMRWLIGDRPITVGPIGFGIVTLKDCLEPRILIDRQFWTAPAECEGIVYNGRPISAQDGQLFIRNQAVPVEGTALEITGIDLDINSDNKLVYEADGRVLSLDGRELVVDGLALRTAQGAVTIKGKRVEANDTLIIVNNEIIARNGTISSPSGTIAIIDGVPVSIFTPVVEAAGNSVRVSSEGGLEYRGEAFTYPDGIFTIDGRDVLMNGRAMTRSDKLAIVDNRLIAINNEPVEGIENFTLLNGRISAGDGYLSAVNSGGQIPVNVDVLSVSRSELTLDNDDLKYGDMLLVVDGDLITAVDQIITIRGREVGPDDKIVLLDDQIISLRDTILTTGNYLAVVDGEIVYQDYHTIAGTILFEGQSTLWEGRELPVFDNSGNLVGYEVNGIAEGLLRGDMGRSLISQRPVKDLVAEKLPATLELGVMALLVGLIIGIPVGVLAAVYQGSWFDQITRVTAVIVSAVPVFWLGLILLLIFGAWLNILPMGNRVPIANITGDYSLWDRIRHLILPTFTLSSFTIATFSRFMRASLLDVLNQDYIRTAKAKGLSNRRTWFVHGMRNALIPIATILGPSITGVIGGAVLTETIYSWPGMGRLVVDSVQQQDYPVIMAVTILFAIATVIGFLLSDLFYAFLDPRIRLS